MAIEENFDVTFISKLTAEEKQIQQNYRPVIGVHKWFARRPGSLFRGLMLAEFCEGALGKEYFRAHLFDGLTVADPFMGGVRMIRNQLQPYMIGLILGSVAAVLLWDAVAIYKVARGYTGQIYVTW